MAFRDTRQVCAPWITTADLCCAGGGDVVDCNGVPTPLVYPWTDDDLILSASNILFARTCYRYTGVCNAIVWPCLDCSSCDGPCLCSAPYYDIVLDSNLPVIAINSVTINGVVEPSANYRLDEAQRIVKTDGLPWPPSNNLGLPDGGQYEVVVDFDYGIAPPIELTMACSELVCELKKACNSDESCKLPNSATRVVRRGVETENISMLALIQTDFTGNPIIDHALKVHGNCGQATMYDPIRANKNKRMGLP